MKIEPGSGPLVRVRERVVERFLGDLGQLLPVKGHQALRAFRLQVDLRAVPRVGRAVEESSDSGLDACDSRCRDMERCQRPAERSRHKRSYKRPGKIDTPLLSACTGTASTHPARGNRLVPG
jgi:hypothetical protein